MNQHAETEQQQRDHWDVFVDTGGTFTDCLALDPRRHAHRMKVLSSGVLRARVKRIVSERAIEVQPMRSVAPDLLVGWSVRWSTGGALRTITAVNPSAWQCELDGPLAGAGSSVDLSTGEEAPTLAVRLMTQTPVGQSMPSVSMRLATTRGTNALLEHRGAPTALFITRGFGDLLTIGDQSRPDLFALHIIKPEPVCAHVVEVDERIDAQGGVLRVIELDSLEIQAKTLLRKGVKSAAVALMQSYVNPAHELVLAERLRAWGFEHVSVSSELAPLIKLLPRAQTAAVDATLSPIVGAYVDSVKRSLQANELRMMTSAGGMVQAASFRAKDGLLSGPAGGVVGALAAAKRSGFDKVISFDMGGTSTDVARLDGEPTYQSEHEVAGVRVFAPALAIETVAAGGGSICDFEQDVITVGPASAGAHPGPACYGVGGPLTLTDVNLLLGRLSPAMFEIPISVDAAEAALSALREKIAARTGTTPTREMLLEGILSVANQRMAEGIARVSVRHGYDPARYALVAFGGAGAQHACAIAELLGIATIIMPAEASVLSAYGLAHAPIERFAERQVLERLDACAAQVESVWRALEDEACAQLAREGDVRDVRIRRFAEMRLSGQDSAITVECSSAGELAAQFEGAYRMMYGHAPRGAGKSIEVAALRVKVSAHGSEGLRLDDALGLCADERTVNGCALCAGDAVAPGAVVAGASTSCVIGAGWSGEVEAHGTIILSKHKTTADVDDAAPDAIVRDTLVANRLSSIAETMGEQLRRTAISTNVKERLDFSCALHDANGSLVVSAAHIPVHLGALGHCVRAVIARWHATGKVFQPGDVVVTNHPAFGGSHLPDVTVITPVFAGTDLMGFTASRAHHAEIGGSRPGSMPPSAKRLVEEGVVIEPMLLAAAGEERFEDVERVLRSGLYPSRAVQDNLADLRAAVSANHRGALMLQALASELGTAALRGHLAGLLDRSERLVREAIGRVRAGERSAHEQMDDGSAIMVRADVKADRVTIDFTGTAEKHAGNLNATPAIVASAVMYVMRLLVDEPVPLNDGLLRAVKIELPRCMLNPDFSGEEGAMPAVVGGNVETSTRVVDALLAALELCACSQGTMNNVLFGTPTWAYYETICGGSGAGPGFDGTDAVHTHMTNTRITDPEVLEKRYPVRLERFAIRVGSGGAGEYTGGAGAVREMTFLEPVELSMLTQRRTVGPGGLAGGAPGSCGAQRVIRETGEVEQLDSIDGCDVGAGDRLVIETPGGGGCGPVTPRDLRRGGA